MRPHGRGSTSAGEDTVSDLQYAFEVTFLSLVCAGCLSIFAFAIAVTFRAWMDKRMQEQRRIANSRIYTVGRDCFKFTKGVHH